jgi:hypothetical protein
MRYKIKFVVFLGLLVLPAITANAQFFSTDTTKIQFGPNKIQMA